MCAADEAEVAENFRERGMDFASPSLDIQRCGALLADASPTTVSAFALTIAAGICAAGLAVLMRPGAQGIRIAGTVLALVGFAMLSVEVIKRASVGSEAAGFPPVFPVIFGLLSTIGAVRVITHPRPVFAAMYFMLTVVSTACMFLLLGAEFMAFALVIVYAGAILITYLFVLMLAQQSPVVGVGDAWYDRVPREAISAVFIGFVMLATLSDAYFSAKGQSFIADKMQASEFDGTVAGWKRLDAMPKLLRVAAEQTLAVEVAMAKDPTAAATTPVAISEVVRDANGSAITMHADTASIVVKLTDGSTRTLALAPSMMPENSRQVGVDLVSKFPAGLEIAGVVLLMALFGAVILARKQIELGEDERRELAGMRRFTVEGEAGGSGGMQ